MTNRTPAPKETQPSPPAWKTGPVTEATRKYWIEIVLGWADARLPGPQYDECYTALHQDSADLRQQRDDLLAAAQETRIFLFNLWANGPASVSLEAIQEMRERLSRAILSAKEAGVK